MSNWQYSNAALTVAKRIDSQGAYESRLVSAIPEDEYPIDAYAPTPEELAAIAAELREANDRFAASTYAKLQALRAMSPAQVDAWVENNVTNLATAKDALKTLAIAVAILARRI